MKPAKLFSMGILLAGTALFSTACKKEGPKADPVNPNNNLEPVNVLKKVPDSHTFTTM